MIKEKYIVKKPFSMCYGNHIGAKKLGTSRMLSIGEEVTHERSAPNGNQWLIDKDGERGTAYGFYSFSALLNKGYLADSENSPENTQDQERP